MIAVQIDNLLKLVGQLKNNLYRDGKISIVQKREIEAEISKLASSYDNAFDLIRDKLAAHAQPIDLIALLDWWGSFDYSAVEILYSDCKSIQGHFESINDVNFLNVPDYSLIITDQSAAISKPTLSMSRLALSEPNTVSLIACHPSQEKAQTIVAITEFLSVDFFLTNLVDNPHTIFRRLVFDIGWMLAIIDLTSLIDNLFADTQHDQSLLKYWESGFGGLARLQQLDQSRNLALENEIREIRNKFSAHLDKDDSLSSLYSKFEALDLGSIHLYTCQMVNGFLEACREDVRTKMFAVQRTELQGVIKVANPGKPFAN